MICRPSGAKNDLPGQPLRLLSPLRGSKRLDFIHFFKPRAKALGYDRSPLRGCKEAFRIASDNDLSGQTLTVGES